MAYAAGIDEERLNTIGNDRRGMRNYFSHRWYETAVYDKIKFQSTNSTFLIITLFIIIL